MTTSFSADSFARERVACASAPEAQARITNAAPAALGGARLPNAPSPAATVPPFRARAGRALAPFRLSRKATGLPATEIAKL
jgi:hypothetical protein